MLSNIRGIKFDQDSLPYNLENTKAGQQALFKGGLCIFVILFFFIASFLASKIGIESSFEIGLNTKYKQDFILTNIVVWIWILVGIKSFRTSILIILVLLPPLLIIFYDKLFHKANLGLLTIFQNLTVSTISFSLFSLAIALTNILFTNSRILQILGAIATLVGVSASGFYIISTVMRAPDSPYAKYWLSSSNVQMGILATGTFYSFGWGFSAWLANRVRKIPWNPSSPFSVFISSVAIAVGTWQGTSFYNLDLSGVNLKNAKLANTDLRARKLYRTCFQGVDGLERARVDSRYLDLEIPKVKKLLTHGCSEDPDFSSLNLRGAYLRNADLREMKFIDTVFTGADMQNADIRGSILAGAQVVGVDFTNAKLTGICIQDWNVNSQTNFTNVECEYIYRQLDDRRVPCDRYPLEGRNFEPREFESLYQEVGNVVELVFQEGINWRAFAFTLQKLQIEDDGLGLELKGIEKRGNLWVMKVTHNENAPKEVVEQRLNGMYPEMLNLLATKEQQINKLLGIAADQAEALKGYSKQTFGNSFFITGSTITNLAGSGQIDYDEAAGQVRSIIAQGGNSVVLNPEAQNLLNQLRGQSVATTADQQVELIQQVILAEADKDPFFKQFLLQHQQITNTMPDSIIARAMQAAISQLS